MSSGPAALCTGAPYSGTVSRTDVLYWPDMRSEYSWIPPGEEPSFTGPNQVGVSFSAHQGTVANADNR